MTYASETWVLKETIIQKLLVFERKVIHSILLNNFFPIPSHTHHIPKQHLPLHTLEKEHKCITFTYTGKETRHITNLFKHSNLQIAFRTNNTLHNLLTRNTHYRDKYTCSGIYKLTCPNCGKAYIGQTGGDFAPRYNEHNGLSNTIPTHLDLPNT